MDTWQEWPNHKPVSSQAYTNQYYFVFPHSQAHHTPLQWLCPSEWCLQLFKLVSVNLNQADISLRQMLKGLSPKHWPLTVTQCTILYFPQTGLPLFQFQFELYCNIASSHLLYPWIPVILISLYYIFGLA